MSKASNVAAGLVSAAALASILAAWSAGGLSIRLHGSRADELVVDQSALTVPSARPLQDLSLSFTVRNHSGGVVDIVGAGGSCGPTGCVEVDGLPVGIVSGGERTIPVRFRAGRPGEFIKEFPIYTSYPTKHVIVLAVRGLVREAD